MVLASFGENIELNEKQKRNITILETLRRFGPLTRPEISQRLGVNVVTISHYIEDFIRKKLVLERELDVSEGGRRPQLLEFNSTAGFSIGIGLNLMNIVGILIDLKGNIILKTQIERPSVLVDEVVKYLLEMICQILRRSKNYTKDIKGIGIGIAGIIDKRNGTIRWPERLSHNYIEYASVNLPLKELIEKEFGLPVIIENDATAACFGEQWLELEPHLKNVIYMLSGVGLGMAINGEIYIGSSGCAGEPSIHNYNQEELFNCSMGNPCFLKRWNLDLGIVNDIKSRLAKDKDLAESFFNLTSTNMNSIDLKSVFMASQANHPVARSSLNMAAERLGIKIAYLVNLFNPEIVVIGGGLEEAGEDFLNKINLVVRNWAFRETTEDLKVVYSRLRENAVAFGAAGIVCQQVFAGLL